MRILLLTDGIFPYVMGGMQKHSYNLVKYLTTDENEITLLHCVGNSSKCPSSLDVKKLVFNEERNNFTDYCVQFPKGGKLPGHYLRSSKKLSQIYWAIVKDKITEYDFIFSQGFTAWEFLINKALCPPIGIHFHGYNSFQKSFGIKPMLEGFMFNREIRAYAKMTDYLFSLGGNMTNLIRDKVPFPEERILSSLNGIEEFWLSNSPKKFSDVRKFIFVGRPNKIKAIDIIYQGIKRLTNKAEFHFIGNFPEQEKLKLSNVQYWGEISDEVVLRNIYESCDVLLCPSYSEGLPTVILESMALGLPVIATNVGAVEEVVKNNVNGLLIESGNVGEFVTALKYYCELDIMKLNQQSLAAKQTISDTFLWNNVIKQTIDGIKQEIIKI